MGENPDLQHAVAPRLVDLARRRWPDVTHVRMRIYVMGATTRTEQLLVVNVDEAIALLRHGSLRYPTRPSFAPDSTGREFEITAPEMREIADGDFLILMTTALPESVFDEPAGRARLDTAAALFASLVSPNAILRELCEHVESVLRVEVVVPGEAIRLPGWHDAVLLDESRCRVLHGASEAIVALAEKRRNRIRLALRWYASALSGMDHVDNFVRIWVGLEALAGSSGGVSAALASAYSIGRADAEKRFGVNGLYVWRCNIVHRGDRPSIDAELLRIVGAIFEDVLLQQLGQPSEERAERLLAGRQLRARDFMHVASAQA